MISIIAAYAKNRVIGKDGRIPWKIPGEQKRFKELTTGNVVIMGRRTYEEIGRPLPNRQTYLISSTLRVEEENCHTVDSLDEAIRLAGDREIFISGGGMLYKEALPMADRLYITEIDLDVEGDAFFPEYSKDDFTVIGRELHDGEIPYAYITLERNK